MVLRHPDGNYTITATYSVPDDAWYLELDLVAKQETLVTAIVPDEDPAREPTVCLTPHCRDHLPTAGALAVVPPEVCVRGRAPDRQGHAQEKTVDRLGGYAVLRTEVSR